MLPTFRTVTRTQGNNRALKDGRVKTTGFNFAFEEVDPLIGAFRRMVRNSEFDICEMAMTTYICARSFGTPMIAIPVFIVRGFHHGAILINTKVGVRNPKDLESKRVGVNRGYTVTTGVWARGVLAEEYGVDLNKITWVLSGDEHVAEYQPPSNVVPVEKGREIAEMLICGELAGAIGVDVKHPDIAPLIPNAADAGMNAFLSRRHYPINHTVVIKNDLKDANPGLAQNVFEAFSAAKALYLDELRHETIDNPTAVDALHRRVMQATGDPLPYGVEPNRAVLNELIGHAVAQGIIKNAVTVDELFAPETRSLLG